MKGKAEGKQNCFRVMILIQTELHYGSDICRKNKTTIKKKLMNMENNNGDARISWRDGAVLVFKQVLMAVVVMGTAGFIVPPLYKLIMGEVNMVNTTIISSALYSLVLLVIFTRKKWCVLTGTYFRSRPWAVLLWTAIAALGWIIVSGALEEVMPELPNLVEEEITQLINNDFGYFTLCLFAPLIEEMIFRGAVLRTLLRSMQSRWGAIAVSALLFALIHMNPAQMLGAFLAGLFLGWLFSRTGSILPGVVFHWVNNTVVFLFCRMMPQYADANFSDFFGGNQKNMFLAVAFSLLIVLPAVYQLSIRTRDKAA